MAGETYDILFNARMRVSDVITSVGQIQKSLQGLTIPKGISDDLEKSFNKLNPLLKDYQKQLSKGFDTKKDLNNFNLLRSKIDDVFGEIKSKIGEINGQEIRFKTDVSEITKMEKELDKATSDMQKHLEKLYKSSNSKESITAGFNELKNAIPSSFSGLAREAEKAMSAFQSENFAEANRQIEQMKTHISSMADRSKIKLAESLGFKNIGEDADKAKAAIDKFLNSLQTNKTSASAIERITQQIRELVPNIEQAKIDSLTKGLEELGGTSGNIDAVALAMRDVGIAGEEAGSSVLNMKAQVEQLKTSTQYFFSLRNMINLLKRGVDEAVESVKELDAAMTQTAVVTDFSVSDMWEKLPEYTANANALGASVKDMYEATTLYYQQGLNTEQSMSIAAETMKMARIGGLEAADATDKMTAALRGFNMELDEASAKRVNDVYSNLAAKTASDTEELGTAMQRTASIAASAGMSFEGTAAFLAQAIETTREPAENLGTAMKTIVARFTELKKNPLEIAEVDGEEVSYNKVDTALQSIGVSLKDANGQFRDLDQVFLDISQRWDSLTQTQQRYIATTAAGSRQQSRFIAMMSNYDRTVQLMDYANNSAGASNEQFGKTMESLEAKLNKLHNAWQQFEMGIADNTIIKGAVDGLTGVLGLVNKILDTLSLGSSGIKSILSLFTAFTGLKMAGRLANSVIGGLGGILDPKSSFMEGLKGGITGRKQAVNNAQAQAISTPIVNKLGEILSAIHNIKSQPINDQINNTNNRETSKDQYTTARQAFNQLGEREFTINEASQIFSGLDKKHQLSLFKNSPGTRAAMKKASFGWFDSKQLSKEFTNEGKQYINSIYKGMSQGQISVDKGIELIGRPDLWGEHFGTETAQAISESFQANAEKASRAAQKGTWRQLNMGGASEEARKAFLKDSVNAKRYSEALAKNYNKAMQGLNGHGQAGGSVTSLGVLANDIGKIGDKFTQAGYGITAFGNVLSQLGGPIGVVGVGLQSLGGIISNLGMTVSGVTSLFNIFSEGISFGGFAIAGAELAAILAPIAAIGATALVIKKYIDSIKKAGEKVTDTFNKSNKTVEDNISKLKSYQGELATLSKGVDANGNNVNLSDSDYQRYLEIVDSIAEINPKIVKGYNAQGHAIIDNNTALTETLQLQEKIKKEALDEYLDPERGLQKLINARNVNTDYGKATRRYQGSKAEDAGLIHNQVAPLANDVATVADRIGLIKGFDEKTLQKYGIESLDALKEGEAQAVKNFVKHRDKIESELSSFMAESNEQLDEGLIKSFEKLGENSEAFDEAIKPVYDNLLTAVSQSPLYDSVADEFKDALNIGLKDLASQNLSAKEMSKQANQMLAKFSNLTTGSGKYADAIKIVDKAQEEFAKTLDETEYQADVQPAIDELIRLKEEALKDGTAYGNALVEYLENQIERISRFTEEGSENLTQALNTATNEIAAAEGALESFNEATKTDYFTAAEGMKSIFDKTTEKYTDIYGSEIQKHAEGYGDATFWTGADTLLGEKTVDKLTKGKEGVEAVEAISNALKKMEPLLQEGQDGFDAFRDRVLESVPALQDLAGVTWDESGMLTNIPEDQWHNVAEALGMSDEMLTSMLNKARQFSDISFANLDDARKALTTSEYTIQGTKTQEDGTKNLYVKEETLRNELANAGYVRREQQNEQIEKLLEKGVKTIPTADSMSTKELKSMADDWGVKNLPDLIQKLNETGDFTKEEIKGYADKLGMSGTDDTFNQAYDSILAAAENPELAKQTSELQSINAKVGALLDRRSSSEQTSAWKDFHNAVYGGEGVDTAFQHFARGHDENGESLNAGEYATTKKNMEEAAQTAEEASAKYKYMAEQSSGADQKHFEDLANNYKADAEHIRNLMAAGEQAYADAQKNIDQERKYAQGRNEGREQQQRQQQQQKAKDNTAAANEKGKTQTNTIVNNVEENKTTHETTVFDAEVDPELEDLNAKYGYDRTTKTVVNYLTKGEGDLQLAEDKISQIDLAAQDPKQVIIEANTNGVTLAQAALDTLPKSKSVAVNLTDNISSKLASIAIKISSLAAKAREVKLNGVAIGQNNHIKHQTMPSFGSAAKGYGTVGPKNKGGLTLTGEKGFEIAWLPSENRSMILGAAGPQMLNLPADAVVYTHEQSEDILKQRAIPAGSHYTAASSSSVKRKTNKSSSSGSAKNKSKKKSKKKSKDKDNTEKELKIVNFSIEETVQFNIEAKLAKLAYEINKRTKTIEKTLSRVGATSKEIEGNIKDQVDALNQQKQANADLLASYQRQTNEIFNWQEQISYQTTETKTTGKGKKKKTTTENVTKTMTINVRDYITQLADGVYGVNEAAVAALGTPELRKGAHDAATNLVSSINSGMIKAKEAMDEADEKIEELNSKLYEAFNRWEKSINEIYLISQKLESINKRRNIRDAQIELELTKLQAGFADAGASIEVLTSLAKKSMNELRQGIEGDYALIVERYKEFNKLLDISTYQELQNTTEGRNKYAAAEIALKLYKEAKGDMSQALAGIRQGIEDYQKTGYANPTDKAVEEVLDTIEKGRGDLYDSIETILDDISNAFDKLIEYQETIKSFEDKLLEGLEEQAEKQVDELSKLNDSISNALKDLLDEVRRNLEARRRAEDNAKTEQDISRKQQRLAALRANTSGGNQVEIKQLEKEIAEAQQSYQRTLEDQLLDKLQEQGDQAAKQRERQIELLEEQVETESGTNRALVELWLSDPQKFENEIRQAWLKANGYDEETARGQALLDAQFKRDFAEVVMALRQTEIGNQIDGVEDDLTTIIRLLLRGLPDVGDNELSDLINDLSDADKTVESAKRFKKFGLTASNLKEAGWGAAELIGANYSASELKEAGFTAKDLVDNGFDKNAKTLKEGGYNTIDLKEAGFNFSDLISDFNFKELAQAFNEADFKNNNVSYSEAVQTFGNSDANLVKLRDVGYTEAGNELNRRAEQRRIEEERRRAAEAAAAAAAAAAAPGNSNPYGRTSNISESIKSSSSKNSIKSLQWTLKQLGYYGDKIDGSWGKNTEAAAKAFKKKYKAQFGLDNNSTFGGGSKNALRALGYKTGGLADYTGPAWLDGTPSKPELVLNATDTKNFIALKDVLSHAMGSSGHIQNSYGGNNVYEININVDKIEKDYDVDKLTERVKKNIVKDASYRNVTQVRNLR